jgi:hypothetical protein
MFIKLGIGISFEYISRKLKFDKNLTRMTGTLHGDVQGWAKVGLPL